LIFWPLKDNISIEKILWHEATWLKDYVSIFKSGNLDSKILTREKALKSLILCDLQGCFSYGYELAILFGEFKLCH